MTSWLLRTWDTPVCSIRPKAAIPLLKLGSSLYTLGLKRDQQRAESRKRRLPAYVISVGNLTTGGTGKTPFTLWLSSFVGGLGLPHAILSRGYGRSGKTTCRVPREGESSVLARRFGDEPVLMARKIPSVPVWVGRNRWECGNAALLDFGAQVLILDDGFQHLGLARDLDCVLLDAHNPFGNASVLPLGPLREPIGHLRRADAIILTRADEPLMVHQTRSQLKEWFPEKPVFSCRHRLTGFRAGFAEKTLPVESLVGKRAVAFAGLAGTRTFFDALKDPGIEIVEEVEYADHYSYRREDISFLLSLCREAKAEYLITTEKDLVRLPSWTHSMVLAAQLQLDFGEERDRLCSYLEEVLPRRSLRPDNT